MCAIQRTLSLRYTPNEESTTWRRWCAQGLAVLHREKGPTSVRPEESRVPSGMPPVRDRLRTPHGAPRVFQALGTCTVARAHARTETNGRRTACFSRAVWRAPHIPMRWMCRVCMPPPYSPWQDATSAPPSMCARTKRWMIHTIGCTPPTSMWLDRCRCARKFRVHPCGRQSVSGHALHPA